LPWEVILVTAIGSESVCDLGMAAVEDNRSRRLAELNTRLQELLDQATNATDSAKYDELCAEIWKVMQEKDRIRDGQS
jgi:predicted phosphoribosyltransferase